MTAPQERYLFTINVLTAWCHSSTPTHRGGNMLGTEKLRWIKFQ